MSQTSQPDQISQPDSQPGSQPDTSPPATEDAAIAASTQKPPEEWVTGDEPATGAQLSYLSTLAREANEPVPDNLTKAHASELIDQYQQKSPRVE